jgi:hypothetical protein
VRWWRLARAGTLALACGGAFGCTAYATNKTVPVNCSVEDAYDFKSVDNFEMPPMQPMWTTADCTPGALMTVTEASLPDGSRCGSTVALEIQASRNADWGSLAGYNGFGPRDGSAYEGISFWARGAVDSNKAFTLSLDDPNTAAGTVGTTCTTYPTPDAGACTLAASTTIIDPATGMVLSSGTLTAPPLPDQCGNAYTVVVLVTGDWQLYTIPFGRFQQGATPNRVPNAELAATGSAAGTTLITSQLMLFGLRLPKALATDLWIDDLAFYRHKGWAPPGRDGGVDGP